MTTVYDVPAGLLIEKAASKLKKEKELVPPDWAEYVKTGIHREKAPVDRDWWHKRQAAVLRKVYVLGPIGTSRLAAEFGGKVDRGSKPYKAGKGSGSIIRTSLQQLENTGYILKEKNSGRRISPKGQRFLDNLAHEIAKELAKENPEMSKYV